MQAAISKFEPITPQLADGQLTRAPGMGKNISYVFYKTY